MIKIFPDSDELNFFAAEKFVEMANKAIGESGRFTVALAGGSTPESLYQLLAGDKFKNRIDWTKVFFFFGDERNVSPDSEESNFRMANESLFKFLQISDENIFRWQTELKDAEKIAENYRISVTNFFALSENELPRFDLILLGMGEDGHTASLFPFTEGLKESGKIVVVNWVEKLNTNRLTFTYPMINNASNVIFLVGGASKAEALKEILEGEYQPERYPAQAVKLNDGDLFWLIERRTARLLN
ncbi:MAG: 6-phosphogluconolactonase [Acidobacteriota bacterium]|nr:6-phosphogluconolactonase [Acidobacteriota bacterium]